MLYVNIIQKNLLNIGNATDKPNILVISKWRIIMDKIVVNGGSQLKGDVNISTAKNSVLPIIAGSILSGNKCVIDNAPMLEDVFVIGEILKSISAKVNIDEVNNRVIIDSKPVDNLEPDSDLVKK